MANATTSTLIVKVPTRVAGGIRDSRDWLVVGKSLAFEKDGGGMRSSASSESSGGEESSSRESSRESSPEFVRKAEPRRKSSRNPRQPGAFSGGLLHRPQILRRPKSQGRTDGLVSVVHLS